MKKYNIAVVGLRNASNLGDPLICDSIEYLIRKTLNNRCDIIPVDLYPKIAEGPSDKRRAKIIKKLIKSSSSKSNPLKQLILEGAIELSGLKKSYSEYFREQFKEADYIVFAGGGLIKFKQQEKINLAISCAVAEAEKLNIPVAFHACGVEGYDPKIKGCKRLEEAINSHTVKAITTRDDLDTLENCYKKREDLYVGYAADSAVWAAEMLGIEKDPSSDVIGLGIARGNIFEEYGVPFNDQDLIELYVNIIKSLQRRGVKWKLFCNGYLPDYKFGLKILKALKLDKSHILKLPTNCNELVEQVSQFSGVIALRLHACIISYSLNIPVLGLCWNQKVKHFGKAIGYPDRFYEYEDFDGEILAREVLKAAKEGYDQDTREEYRMTSIKSIEKIFEDIL